jgi:hypothetical protein
LVNRTRAHGDTPSQAASDGYASKAAVHCQTNFLDSQSLDFMGLIFRPISYPLPDGIGGKRMLCGHIFWNA